MIKRKPLSEAHKEKIAASQKQRWTDRKAKIALAEQVAEPSTKKIGHFGLRDAARNTGRFRDMKPQQVVSILDSTKYGVLRDWMDATDQIQQTDAHLSGLVNIRKMAVSSKRIEVEPADASPEAKAAAEFVQRELDSIEDLSESLFQLLDGIFRGLAVQEIMWVRKAGYFGVKGLCWTPGRMLRYGDDFQIQLLPEGSYARSYGEDLPPNKFVVHVPNESIYPTDRGLYRTLIWLVVFKHWGLKFWLGGAEKFSFPAIIAKVPQSCPANIKDDLRRDLEQMVTDSVGVVETDVEITPLTYSPAGENIWDALTKTFNGEMTKMVLGGTLTVETGKDGTNRASAEVHERTKFEISEADAKALANTLRGDLVTPLLAFNTHLFGGVMPPIPKLIFKISDNEIAPLPEFLFKGKLVRKNEVRKSYGLPPASAEEGGEDLLDLRDVPQPQFSQTPANDNGAELDSIPLAQTRSQTQSLQTSGDWTKALEPALKRRSDGSGF